VHALRALTLSGGSSVLGLALDVGVLLAVTTVVVVIAGLPHSTPIGPPILRDYEWVLTRERSARPNIGQVTDLISAKRHESITEDKLLFASI
jgi:hypothetical protein